MQSKSQYFLFILKNIYFLFILKNIYSIKYFIYLHYFSYKFLLIALKKSYFFNTYQS